jgi:hypothetical protein
MSQLEPNQSYIYEKADGVTYARKFGEKNRVVIGWDHEMFDKIEKMKEDQLWDEIREAAKTNKALQKAMDRVKVIYRLSKDDPL